MFNEPPRGSVHSLDLGRFSITEHGFDPFRDVDGRTITKLRQTVTSDQLFFAADHPF